MDEIYEVAFGLILNSGNSKAKSLLAIESAREYKFEEAETLLKEAQEELRLAHKTQTELIQGEAQGSKTEMNILMVHAQDHLTTAMIMINQAEEFINVYKIISKLLKEEN